MSSPVEADTSVVDCVVIDAALAVEESPHVFEGPEKNLEVHFVGGPAGGLRELVRSDWDEVLDLAKCQILSHMSNRHLDAYVLSESSLFVYAHKCIIKTCGTTTLLRCLSLLLTKARAVGMEVEWIGYSRKNFTFPEHQMFPHRSFSSEVNYAKACMGPQGLPLSGGAHVLGDVTGDHWYLYCADYCERVVTPGEAEGTVNIMMYGIDEEVARIFYRDANPDSINARDDATRATKRSGIDKLVTGARVDNYMFEPCGYSMNALLFDTYYTMHITPEPAFSYASFETNIGAREYSALVRNVLQVFRPKRFTVTVFADLEAIDDGDAANALASIHNGGTAMSSMSTMPSLAANAALTPLSQRLPSGYVNTSSSMTHFKTDYVCHMANFVLGSDASTPQVRTPPEVVVAAAPAGEEGEALARMIASSSSSSSSSMASTSTDEEEEEDVEVDECSPTSGDLNNVPTTTEERISPGMSTSPEPTMCGADNDEAI